LRKLAFIKGSVKSLLSIYFKNIQIRRELYKPKLTWGVFKLNIPPLYLFINKLIGWVNSSSLTPCVNNFSKWFDFGGPFFFMGKILLKVSIGLGFKT